MGRSLSHLLAPFRIFIACYFWTSCSLWQCVETQSICQLPARWLNSSEWPLTYGLLAGAEYIPTYWISSCRISHGASLGFSGSLGHAKISVTVLMTMPTIIWHQVLHATICHAPNTVDTHHLIFVTTAGGRYHPSPIFKGKNWGPGKLLPKPQIWKIAEQGFEPWLLISEFLTTAYIYMFWVKQKFGLSFVAIYLFHKKRFKTQSTNQEEKKASHSSLVDKAHLLGDGGDNWLILSSPVVPFMYILSHNFVIEWGTIPPEIGSDG